MLPSVKERATLFTISVRRYLHYREDEFRGATAMVYWKVPLVIG
jgi:hypothetical protein